MTQQDLQLLAELYNVFYSIKTSGEDTFKMTDSLRAMQRFIMTKNKELEDQGQKEE